jgi:hypothetical protein
MLFFPSSVESVGVRMVPLEKYLLNYANDGQPYPGRMAVLGHTRHPFGLPLSHEGPIVRYAIDQLGYAYNKQELLLLSARIMAAKLSGEDMIAFVNDLEIGQEAKDRLLQLKPRTYIGLARELAERVQPPKKK